MSEIDEEVGRVDPALVNHAPSGHGPTGFDPARDGRYRKKPVVIEAFQWDFQDRNDWPEWAAEDDRIEEVFAILLGIAATGLKIYTPEGPMRVSPGDWIIRGIEGEVYPCKPSVFAASYEPCDSGRLPEGEDPKGLSAEQARAAAQPHRPNSTSLNQGADDGQ